MHHSTAASSALALLLAFTGAAHAQTSYAVYFRGNAGAFGIIEQRNLGAGGGTTLPFGGQALRLLPVEVTGRTELTRVSPTHAWRHADVPGASRIQLPADQGSLYHHEVLLGGGARLFGYFLVDPAGQVRRLIERDGTGAGGDQDPFLPRIGVSPDGGAILCATTLAAGGNLLEVDVASASAIDRTAGEAPRTWIAQSLFLAPSSGVAVHVSGASRFARVPGGQSSPLNFSPSAPGFFTGELVLSNSGDYAALTAGTGPQSLDVYVVAPSGLALRTTPQPGPLSPAGHLPEELDGPFLAVSDDGGQCAWRTEGLTREAFLARVPWQTASGATQLTADSEFTDTIDEVGQYGFHSALDFRFTAGERDTAAGGIDNIDVFNAALPAGAGAPSLSNLSLSSGIPFPPFLEAGEIKPEGAVTLPGGAGRLMADRDADQLILLPPQGGGVNVVLDNVRDLDGLARSGNSWLLALRRSGGNQPRQIARWTQGSAVPPQILYSSDDADSFDNLTLRGNVGTFLERIPPVERLCSCNLTTGSVSAFSPRNFLYGPGLSISSHGEVVTSLGATGMTAIFVRWLPPAGPKRLAPATSPGFVLRGL